MNPWRLLERWRRPGLRVSTLWCPLRRSTPDLWHARGRRAAGWMLLIFVYGTAALSVSGPGVRAPMDVLPTGTATSATVPMFNAWTIWWNADRLSHGFRSYWDAPIFYPERGTFAFSEPQPATLVVAPLVWLTGSPVPAYHVYLIGSLVLNGLFAVRLFRVLEIGWPAAVVGGLAVLFHPLVHQHKEVLQLMPLWGVLWTLAAVLKLRDRSALRGGAELGIAFAAVFMTAIHHGLFFGLLLGLSAWITVPQDNWKRWMRAWAVAAATAALVLLPLLGPLHRILSHHAFSRDNAIARSLSATASDWLRVPQHAMVGPGTAEPPEGRSLAPGWVRLLLAAAGLLAFRRAGRHRRALLFLAVFGSWSLIWSFGPNLRIGGWTPWMTLSDYVSPFAQVRSVFRFAYFTHLAVLVLATVGFDAVLRYLPFSDKRVPWRWPCYGISTVTAVALGALLALEVPPRSGYWRGVPDVSRERAWTAFLREHTSAGRGAVCLPFGDGYGAAQLEPSARWMLYGTQHRVPLANGYSGFFPESWFRLAALLRTDPFGEPTLAMLSESGVEFLVVDTRRAAAPRPSPGQTFLGRAALRPVFRDASGVEIWRIIGPPPVPD